jgi:hypothetical protein
MNVVIQTFTNIKKKLLLCIVAVGEEQYSILNTFIALIFHNWNSKALQTKSMFKNQGMEGVGNKKWK